jgi:hypothetical protein
MFLLSAGVCPVAAQMATNPAPLFRGLFGGAAPIEARDNVLDFSASGYAGYVQDIVPAGQASLPSSTFQGANASLTFQRQWQHATIGAFGNAGTGYFKDAPSDQSPWINRWDVGARAGFDRRIARRTTFSADGNVGYSPYYGFGTIGQGIFNGAGNIQQIPGLDYTVAKQPTLNFAGHVGVSQALSVHSSLEGYYTISNVSFAGSGSATEGYGDQRTQTVGARYRYAINKYVSARAGYGYMRSVYGGIDSEPVISHLIDVGVDGGYGREYHIARRTTFSFDTRSNIFVADQVSTDNTFQPTTQFFLGGSVALAHRWGRTWRADARYDRSAGFVDGFRDPVFSNTSSASVRGLPAPRLDFTASASHAFGNVGFGSINNGFSTTTSTAQLRYALFRNLAAYGQYFYYRYHFDAGVVLPGTVPPMLDRQGGSVGVTLWLPLY